MSENSNDDFYKCCL